MPIDNAAVHSTRIADTMKQMALEKRNSIMGGVESKDAPRLMTPSEWMIYRSLQGDDIDATEIQKSINAKIGKKSARKGFLDHLMDALQLNRNSL